MNKPQKATKKPVEIDFLEWTGGNHRPMFDFLTSSKGESIVAYAVNGDYMGCSGDNFYINHNSVDGGLIIKTLEGEHLANIGDMILKGVNGEFYPCKPDIFALTYDVD